MKKCLLIIVLAFLFNIKSISAQEVFIGIQSGLRINQVEDNNKFFDLVLKLGVRSGKYLGGELRFGRSNESEFFKGNHFGIYYKPFITYGKINIYSLIGLSVFNAEEFGSHSGFTKSHSVNFLGFGLGIQTNGGFFLEILTKTVTVPIDFMYKIDFSGNPKKFEEFKTLAKLNFGFQFNL